MTKVKLTKVQLCGVVSRGGREKQLNVKESRSSGTGGDQKKLKILD